MTLVQPPAEMQVFIREALNEDVSTRDSHLEHIKEWLKKQPHLPDTWDDNRIMTFLRGCKFSLEKTKRKLDMYFTMRAAVPQVFTNRDIKNPELQEILKYGQVPPLPGLTPEGYRVVVLRGIDKNVLHPSPYDLAKLVLMIGDVRLAAEETGVAGDVYILDASIITSAHVAKVTPTMVKQFLVCVQEGYPVKLKQVHVLNVSPLIETLISWVKPFLKEKIRNRIFVHSTNDTLANYIPKDVLPEEYGGTGGSLLDIQDEWVKKLDEYTPWFKEQDNVNADESKRPGKPTNYEDLFGMEGSFKQLNID